jgi:hypothetical protein
MQLLEKSLVKLHKKYGINNSYDNLDALIATTDSLTIITSISAHGENALLLNIKNKKLKYNWFSQLLYVSLDSNNNIEVKDIFEYPTIKDLAIQATEERVSDFIEKAE